MEKAVDTTQIPSVTRRGSIAAVSVFLAVLSVGLATVPVALNAARVGGNPTDGEWARRFEAEYTESLPFRDVAVSAVGALRYTVFGEGRAGVLVGSDSWLFSAEEYAGAADGSLPMEAALERVRTVARALADRDIELVVAVLPAKARVYAEKLRRPLPPAAGRRYGAFRRALVDTNIVAPDLAAALMDAKPRGDLFYATDTHWTARGASVAAAAISAAITESLPDVTLGRVSFEAGPPEEVEFSGDLVSYLSLGFLTDRLGPPPEQAQLRTLRRTDADSPGLFGTPSIPVALVGTSYSADPLWGFASALKRKLAADVLTVAAEGRGPFVPMETYLAGDTIDEIPPRLVIWEIPERYVATSQ